MSSQKSINGISKFLFSTLVAAAAMTSTAWAEGTTETNTLEGNTLISTDTTLGGTTISTGVTKVANGATLTIAGTYNGTNLAAGNDAHFNFGEDGDTKGGTIDIVGNVTVNQTNADGDGVVNVKEGALLNSAEFCVENGNVSNATSGVVNVYGFVKTASMRIFSGGVVNVSGEIIADHADNVSSQKDISIWGGGVLNVNSGGSVSVAESMEISSDGFVKVVGGIFKVVSTLTNSGTFTVSGTSTLDIASLSGNAVYVVGTATLTNTSVGGSVYAGYGANKTAADLTIAGTFVATALYVGNKTEDYTDGTCHLLKVKSGTDLNLGSLYVRTTTAGTITDTEGVIGDLFVRGSLDVSGSTLTNKGGKGETGHWAVYEDDDTSKTASLNFTNSTITGNYIAVGRNSNSESAADSNAQMSVKNSELTLSGGLYVLGSETFANNKVDVTDSSVLTANKVYVGTGATISLTDSTLTAGTLSNNEGAKFTMTDSTLKVSKLDNEAEMYVGGKSTIQVEDATGSGWSVRVMDKSTLVNSYVKAEDNLTLRMLGSMTVEGGLDVAYLHGAQTEKNGIGGTLTLVDDCTVNASYGVEFSNNYTLKGGSIVISGSSDVWGMVFQHGTYDIGTNMTIDKGGVIHFTKAIATVRSKIETINGEENMGIIHIGHPMAGNDSEVSLEKGSALIGKTMKIYEGSELSVKSGATLSVKDITNNGTFTMNGGTLEITGTATLGGTVSVNADEVILSGNLSVASLTTKTLTIAESDVVINITGVSPAAMLLAEGDDTEQTASGLTFDTLKFVVNDESIDAGDSLDLTTLVTDEATREILQSGLEDGDKITIENSATGITYTDCVYNGGAINVPEPSAFGLLAGLGALALVASRRRRK